MLIDGHTGWNLLSLHALIETFLQSIDWWSKTVVWELMVKVSQNWSGWRFLLAEILKRTIKLKVRFIEITNRVYSLDKSRRICIIHWRHLITIHWEHLIKANTIVSCERCVKTLLRCRIEILKSSFSVIRRRSKSLWSCKWLGNPISTRAEVWICTFSRFRNFGRNCNFMLV